MIMIELPWPPKELNPNSRVHWRKRADESSWAKMQGFVGILELRERGSFKGEYQVGYIFHPPDRRKRDQDNCLAMMKPFQDGVCSALNMDDSQIKRTILEWGEVVKGGKVVLRLEEME